MTAEARPVGFPAAAGGGSRPVRSGRLTRINNWERLAQRALYRAPELARLCDVSVRHLQRHFKESFDRGLSSWLGELRLKQARERLRGGWRVDEVAYSLGYKQVSHFSKVFRQHYGCAPSTIQRSGWSVREER